MAIYYARRDTSHVTPWHRDDFGAVRGGRLADAVRKCAAARHERRTDVQQASERKMFSESM